MSQKNDEKIIELLKQNKDKEFRVTEIAEQTGIDIKNMSRYLKSLEEQNRIKVCPIQEGRIRTKLISYAEPKKSEQLSPTPSSGPSPSSSEPKSQVEPQDQRPVKKPKSEEQAPSVTIDKPLRISLEKVLKKIEALPPDNREFQNIVRRVQVQHRKSYIDEVVNLINQYFPELI